MAASTTTASSTNTDYFSGRPEGRRMRPGEAGFRELTTRSPHSPRTPTALNRSISSQYGSPGSFRAAQDDVLVYELGARHFSAGFAGESRPRCILDFTPDRSRRVGDYRQYAPGHTSNGKSAARGNGWGDGHELYKVDLQELDLGLVEDKLERALRTAMVEYLQLDAKPRKAVLVVPPTLPIPLLEVALKVIFGHFTQPPSISLLTSPIMCCVGAGLRHALVIDIGWEETVVTAVSEYKIISQRQTIRAGKQLTKEMAAALKNENLELQLTFPEAEDLTQRIAWCRQKHANTEGDDTNVHVQLGGRREGVQIPFRKLAHPADRALFASESSMQEHDDHDLPIHVAAYKTLISLPVDTRALCVSRLVVTGGVSRLPGLKSRFLQEVADLIRTRGWDPILNYGTAKAPKNLALRERSTNFNFPPPNTSPSLSLSPMKMPLQESISHADRVHDDIKDPVTLKVDREMAKGKADPVKGIVRGAQTLGGWAGASLVANLRIKGVHEVDRDDFQKHGLRNETADL